ncbi:sarcosine oxidase subunit gamma [Kitasatospora sp. NPDC056531]|uniref:sarcosine oxidase subunit gamma n=1 Tax=Kitasatospora sp. NPDC056531 TaxID=3345856 RepID=UPI0036B3613D
MTVDQLRQSPLGHLADTPPASGRGYPHLGPAVTGERGVRLREVPFHAQLNLRLDPAGAAAARVGTALGAALPAQADTAVRAGDLQLLWLGPDEWLVVGPDGSGPTTEWLLRAALADEPGSVVDVSANRTTLELTGPAARQVLEKGCSLDLHPRAFAPGRCAQTTVSKVNVVLHQLDEAPSYRLLVRGSFAQYLADWLLDAMEEYRHPPLPDLP